MPVGEKSDLNLSFSGSNYQSIKCNLERIELLPSKLIAFQNKLDNTYKNTKYKLLNNVRFLISAIQLAITIHVQKQEI